MGTRLAERYSANYSLVCLSAETGAIIWIRVPNNIDAFLLVSNYQLKKQPVQYLNENF